jgi:glutamine synthetase
MATPARSRVNQAVAAKGAVSFQFKARPLASFEGSGAEISASLWQLCGNR